MFTPIRSPNFITKPYVNCDRKQKLHKLKNPVVKGLFFSFSNERRLYLRKRKAIKNASSQLGRLS